MLNVVLLLAHPQKAGYDSGIKTECYWLVAVLPYSVYIMSTQLRTYDNPTKVKETRDPPATYQIRLWSQRGAKVYRPRHCDIFLRWPPLIRNREET